MSSMRRLDPHEMPPPGEDPAVDALLDYLASTTVSPARDLTARIQARIGREPDRTPPRRYVLALLHLRLRTAGGAFNQLLRVTRGQGHFPALLRAQALGLVLLTVLGAAALAAGAAIGITHLVDERRAPTPVVVPDRDLAPTPSPDLATPGPTDPDKVRIAEPTPRRSARTPVPASRTPHPEAERRPSKTTAPDSRAEPTRRPSRTPKPTKRPEPDRTPQPDRTHWPTERPEPTEHPEATEPPDGEDDGGEDDGGGDDGPSEPDAPGEDGEDD